MRWDDPFRLLLVGARWDGLSLPLRPVAAIIAQPSAFCGRLVPAMKSAVGTSAEVGWLGPASGWHFKMWGMKQMAGPTHTVARCTRTDDVIWRSVCRRNGIQRPPQNKRRHTRLNARKNPAIQLITTGAYPPVESNQKPQQSNSSSPGPAGVVDRAVNRGSSPSLRQDYPGLIIIVLEN
jgi:hypothetical protein